MTPGNAQVSQGILSNELIKTFFINVVSIRCNKIGISITNNIDSKSIHLQDGDQTITTNSNDEFGNVTYNQVESFNGMPEGEKKVIFRKARDDKPMKYGDCVFYRDITFHHGAANKSRIVRKYLHLFLSAPTTRWVDFFEVKNNGVFMVNSFQEMMGLNKVLKSIR